MKTLDFIAKVTRSYDVGNDPLSEDTTVIEITQSGKFIAAVWKDQAFKFEFQGDENDTKLMYLVAKYAATPLDQRTEASRLYRVVLPTDQVLTEMNGRYSFQKTDWMPVYLTLQEIINYDKNLVPFKREVTR